MEIYFEMVYRLMTLTYLVFEDYSLTNVNLITKMGDFHDFIRKEKFIYR